MPVSSARTIYAGKVVTMADQILDAGLVFVAGERIDALGLAGDAPRAGWESVPVVETGGVIYPGLVDLHGHLAYNILPPWKVPRQFENRVCWMGSKQYARDIKLPMKALLARGGAALARALVRYVEVKLILGGTTVAQGLRAMGGPGSGVYRGLVRNVEVPDQLGLPGAGTRVPDLRDDQIESMRTSLNTGAPYFFHLAEGFDVRARQQFDLLEQQNLLRDNLVCIHCLGLDDADHQRMRAAGVATVWSPLSNLLLYGRTLDEGALAGPFALGCDWSPSGSRNLLHELKVASLHARHSGWKIDALQLARSVTADAAVASQWGGQLGVLAAGMLADLLVLDERNPDPFENLVHATERDVRLVLIDGLARHGDTQLMSQLVAAGALEQINVGGRDKALHLNDPDSPLNQLSLADALEQLRASMSDLTSPLPLQARVEAAGDDGFAVELDMELDPELEQDLALHALPESLPAELPLSSIPLDPLTVVDDPGYFDQLDAQHNLPSHLKGNFGLRAFYR
ncbi:MAG: amidohydrolase family protein [Rhodocyclaceae bacterium]|nr:amidohydrolase family protein [Rhodocyclaceae bacterium]